MALSNPAPNAVQLESEARASRRPASPVVSGFSTYASMAPKVRTPANTQQQRTTLPRQSLDLASVNEGGKEATTHDFLSLYGTKSASLTETTATRGLASSVTTQNFLQPLEKGSGLLSRGLVTGASVTGQQTSYARVSGTLDLPSNVLYRVDRGDFVTGRIKEDVSEMPEQWAGDASQKPEGKNSDSKESTPRSTPRSKHSAMEQRRRTKINDRFQMLRQLVPNVDQKRDKASFLLEVIDYVKVLQEKARKYEAAEQSWQQERLKPILWDVCQRNPGCRDSSADSSHIPLVPTASLDTKQAPDSNGYMRTSSPLPATCENEIPGAELMSSMGQAVSLSDRPARGPQAHHSSSDIKSVISRTIPVTTPTQTPAVSVLENSSCTPHFVPQATPQAQAMFGHLCHHDEQTAKSFLETKGSMYKRVEVVTSPHLTKKNLVSPESLTNVSELNCERDTTSEESPQNSKQGKSNEESDSLKSSQILLQHSSEMGFCLKEREKDDSRSAFDVNACKEEQKTKVQADEQAAEKEALTVHGGFINISSLYSQGLLDTLTQALQSSGLDLTKATISVQIDLGKPGTGMTATSSRKTATLSSEMLQRQSKESGSSPELEHPRKRSKIEVNV